MSTTTTVRCDMCGIDLKVGSLFEGTVVPVRFTTEQTEGRGITPHLSNEKLDLCLPCMKRIIDGLPLGGSGAQGYNAYYWRDSKSNAPEPSGVRGKGEAQNNS